MPSSSSTTPHILGNARLLLLVLPLGTWALIVNGTFFAALGLRTRNRELMLPLVLFPIALPALLGMVQSTTGILTGGDPVATTVWIRMLAGYDIIYHRLHPAVRRHPPRRIADTL